MYKGFLGILPINVLLSCFVAKKVTTTEGLNLGNSRANLFMDLNDPCDLWPPGGADQSQPFNPFLF